MPDGGFRIQHPWVGGPTGRLYGVQSSTVRYISVGGGALDAPAVPGRNLFRLSAHTQNLLPLRALNERPYIGNLTYTNVGAIIDRPCGTGSQPAPSAGEYEKTDNPSGGCR